ncbi:hypothetical protein GGR51DRAFT_571975 [Nemania sp. FL0031]|nr:hypothetical protein GGR51DRAFT_571975 [Nemania sp. FL0031]
MAVSAQHNAVSIGRVVDFNDGDSDYGSDFSAGEEQLVDEILAELSTNQRFVTAQAATTAKVTAVATTTTTATGRNHDGQSHAHFPTSARSPSPLVPTPNPATTTTGLARVLPPRDIDEDRHQSGLDRHQASSLELVQYPDLSSALSNLQSQSQFQAESKLELMSEPLPKPQQQQQQKQKQQRQQQQQQQQGQYKPPPPTLEKQSGLDSGPDARTPLQRFRSFPRRPLTVTDMAAGAWCELQHWYTLTRLPGGRKTITAAMQGGSRIHQTLEDEVHSAVQVTIASREEAFALRLWNIIQGLRTLRDTGITRELEVWGTVEGEVLNGVIDQLNHESPNASFEQELNLTGSSPSSQQPTITDYLGSSHKTVYLTDVKTRGSDRLPTGTALRPARVQLFLYHRLLSDMAADKLDYAAIFKRYGLDGDAHFSDAFIAQIGGLHDEIFYDADSDIEEVPPETYPPDFIGYRTISQIIPLLKTELRETFPLGPASISNLLAVQYRHRDDGRIIGNNSFPNDPEALDAYMKENLRWWRGEREPEGVTIEETYKCGWCEFAETCQWRKDKEAEFLKKKKRGRANVNHVSPTP